MNKRRHVVRLLFEIAKRDGGRFVRYEYLQGKSFREVQRELLRRRYPESFSYTSQEKFFLPELRLDPEARVQQRHRYPSVKTLYVEKGLWDAVVVQRFRKCYPQARVREIISFREYSRSKKFSLTEYNKRAQTIFFIKERHDYLKPCPCTVGAVRCGYTVFNLGFGCPYECVYCFLQGYQNSSGIVIPVNLDAYFRHIHPLHAQGGVFKSVRIGSGEFTDSLVFDHISLFSADIINYFKAYPNLMFEFKTKSKNIGAILKTRSVPNIVISWSLNPTDIIKKTELYTASLEERIAAARECARAGFRVGIHFDPLIYHADWAKNYRDLVTRLFDNVSHKSIAWISLGSLRLPLGLKKIIENRFPDNTILDAEFSLGYDLKLRYPDPIRLRLYRILQGYIRRRSATVPIYVCMEDERIWKALGLRYT